MGQKKKHEKSLKGGPGSIENSVGEKLPAAEVQVSNRVGQEGNRREGWGETGSGEDTVGDSETWGKNLGDKKSRRVPEKEVPAERGGKAD